MMLRGQSLSQVFDLVTAVILLIIPELSLMELPLLCLLFPCCFLVTHTIPRVSYPYPFQILF